MKAYNSAVKKLKYHREAYREHISLLSVKGELTAPAVLAYCDKIIATIAPDELTAADAEKLEAATDSLIGEMCLEYEFDKPRNLVG